MIVLHEHEDMKNENGITVWNRRGYACIRVVRTLREISTGSDAMSLDSGPGSRFTL